MKRRAVEFKVQSAKDEKHEWRTDDSKAAIAEIRNDAKRQTRTPRRRADGTHAVKVDVWLPEDVHRRLRLYCLDARRTLTSAILDGVLRLLDESGA